MQALQEKLKNLGYKDITDINETTFMASHGDTYVYVKIVDEELRPELVTAITYEAMITDPQSTFAWITNGTNNAYVYVDDEKSIPAIPSIKGEDKFFTRKKELSELDIWSRKQYEELQSKFDAIHEEIYNTTKDHVDSSNDAIDEFCKLIFMEVFLINNPDYILKENDLAGEKLSDIFNYKNIKNAAKKKEKDQAVQKIRAAFKEIIKNEDYVATLDNGEKAFIFNEQDYIKLENPSNYLMVMEALQNLGDIKIDGIERKATLADLTGDVAGRVFDVLLRGKFENKGGMGIYLTPRQITEAAAEIVVHDLTKNGASKLIEKDPETGIPTLRILDPCCGSAGFLINVLSEIKKYLLYNLAGDKKEHEQLFDLMKEHSFVGADNSPGMVLKARINMALHEAQKCPIFKTVNSLTNEQLIPESFDAILTNPPFAKDGISKTKKVKKKKVPNPEGETVIKYFAADIDEDGQNMMNPDGLSLGAKPNKKGKWREVNSIDSAVLFIDKCMQLLKPGGLLMIVVPDSILSNSTYQYIREYIMGVKNEDTQEFEGGKAVLKSVISLPQETFGLSGAGAKTSLLYIKKKEHSGEKQNSVFMAVADEVGFMVKTNVEIQLGDDHNDLLKIIDAYKK